MIKVMVLVHTYDEMGQFVQQLLLPMDATTWQELAGNIEAYSPRVRIMQIIPIPDASEQERSSSARLPEPRPITSVEDLRISALKASLLLESDTLFGPQERADAIHTLTLLRKLTDECLNSHASPNAHVRDADAGRRHA